MREFNIFQEADRQLVICNACRYCEGYCAVFRAIEIRRTFDKADDVFYLANLCHDCRACYYACMYAAPHEFAINIPKLMAEVRVKSYRHWSWPDALGQSFTSGSYAMGIAGAAIAVVLATTAIFVSPARLFGIHTGQGAFYEVLPYASIVIPSIALFFSAVAIWFAGSIRFWLDSGKVSADRSVGFRSFLSALGDALRLTNLKGGGPGCFYPNAEPAQARRIYHVLVSWGFGLAFLSTCVAAVYQEVFGWLPPYRLTSAPVILGSLGGAGMIVGASGLLWIKFKSDPAPAGVAAAHLDYLFLGVLGMTSVTGILTLAFRDTRAMGSILTIHLGFVAAMFVTAPYGKFVHFLYRTLALVRYRIERNP